MSYTAPMERHTACERLVYGDSVEKRLAEENAQTIAARDGVSVEFVAKAMWLARVYSKEHRSVLRDELLHRLTPSQLEAAAKLAPERRHKLLRRAAEEQIPVRELRRLAKQNDPAGVATKLGAADDLASARRALELYAEWDDPSLSRLIAGPNGSTVRALARAGQALAVRLEGRQPPESA